MDLGSIRDVLSSLAALAVIGGVVVAVTQLRDLRRLRQVDVVMQLFDRFDDESFQRLFQRLARWTYRDLESFERKAKDEDWVTLFSISAYFENMGLLYKRKLAPIDLLDDIMSGPITTSWQKVGPIWLEYRRKYARPMMAEWFELLATAIENRMARLEGRRPRIVTVGEATTPAKAAARPRRPRQTIRKAGRRKG